MAQSDTRDEHITAVNSQIADTLEMLTKQVTDNPGDIAASGLALSCAQSLSLAVQDAVDHARRMQMISESMAMKTVGAKTAGKDGANNSEGAALVDAAMTSLKQVTDLATATIKGLSIKH